MNGRLLRTFVRLPLSAMVALSTLAGYVATGKGLSTAGGLTAGGVFFLTCGCSALNQVQERAVDARMHRTRQRPLPMERITPRAALLAALGLLATGFVLLAVPASKIVLVLGGVGVIWYNGVYTWLKPRTAFAAVPGALCGALPIMIGWAAAGGSLGSPALVTLCGFMVIWQVPHFWLLSAAHGEDARRSQLPHVLDHFSETQLLRLCGVWIASLLCCATLLPARGVLHPQLAYPLLAVLVLWSVRVVLRLVKHLGRELPFSYLFSQLNLLAGLILASLLGQGLLLKPF